MKTWEMVKELTENPNKKFKSKREGIIVKRNLRNNAIILDVKDEIMCDATIYLDEEWEEAKEPVDPIKALNALMDGKTIIIENDMVSEQPRKIKNDSRMNLDEKIFTVSDFLEGKWFIED